jgi:hypothetical protein
MSSFDATNQGAYEATPHMTLQSLEAAAIDGDPETQWLVRASVRTLNQMSSSENLAGELDDLAISYQRTGDAEKLIHESAGVVAASGLEPLTSGL